MNHTLKKMMPLLGMICLISCGEADGINETQNSQSPTPPLSRTLTSYESEEALLSELKTSTSKKIENQINSFYMCETGITTGIEEGQPDSTSPVSTSADSASTETASATSFTNTNIQEAGVDEADIVKTDGNYLYVATTSGIDIFRVNPDSDFVKIKTFEIENGAENLFLSQNHLVALQSQLENNEIVTLVLLFDISDPENPLNTSTTTISGSYVDARLVVNKLHLITSDSINFEEIVFPTWDYEKYKAYCFNSSSLYSKKQVQDELNNSLEENLTRIANSALEDWLPRIFTNGSEISLSASSIYWDNITPNTALTLLTSLDLENSKIQTSLIKGVAQEVYASPQAVYFAATRYQNSFTDMIWSSSVDETYTDIHRFSLEHDGENLHHYSGSGSVYGWILNRFSMSEFEGNLRIATTVGFSWSNDSYSNVYVLRTDSEELAVIGKTEKIAPSEQIFAARFIGKRGYVVTFKQIDPLFVINLEDPENPFLQGELEVPGFSTYLHPLDDEHLIGLGRGSEIDDTPSWNESVKLAIFDVSDDENPLLADDLIIGSAGTSSLALYDSHAFTFENTTGRLAIPITYFENNIDKTDSYSDFQYYGIHLYKISEESKIETLAEIELVDSLSEPKRTIFISGAASGRIYIIDNKSVYAVEDQNYTIIKSESLSNDDSDTYCFENAPCQLGQPSMEM